MTERAEKIIRVIWYVCALTIIYLFNISLYWICEYKVNGEQSYILLFPDVVLLVILVILPGWYFNKKLFKGRWRVSELSFVLMLSWQLYLTSENATAALPFKCTVVYNLVGYAIVAAICLIGRAIFKSGKIWLVSFEILVTAISLAQYYVISFRGGPIKFSDIDNIRSAMDISESYKLFLSPTVVVILLQLFAMLFFTIKRKNDTISLKKRGVMLASALVLVTGFLISSDYTYNLGIRMRYITFGFSGEEDTLSYRNAGNLLTLYYSARYEVLKEPENYSDERVRELLEKYDNDEEQTQKNMPTIIAIMDESFSDYSHIGDFEVSSDYIPYFRKLDCVEKGYVTVSAYGGYSCNSEWEFLTGNSMYFVPSGFAAYTNCMSASQPGMVRDLKALGYNTTAVAMCWRSLWNIEKAYEYLGFDDCYFMDNLGIENPEYINGNISDRSAFERIIQLYEERDTSTPQFFWLTTMQNHAEYETDVDNGIELLSNSNVDAERYLNTIKATDEAVEMLIDYFENVDDDVIIVFFGDHYPHIPSFTESVYRQKLGNLSVEDYSRVHQTPYFIWRKNDKSRREVLDISLNYLGCELFDIAGLAKSPFMNFLSEIRENYQIISGFGYKNEQGWYSKSSDRDDILENYEILEYYHMKKYE